MTDNPASRDLARRLLALEFGGPEISGNEVQAASHMLRVLYDCLGRWFGMDGIQTLYTRALDRARASHPVLAEASIDATGAEVLHVPAAIGNAAKNAEIHEAIVELITEVLEILTRLIGNDLVTRLLREIVTEQRQQKATLKLRKPTKRNHHDE